MAITTLCPRNVSASGSCGFGRVPLSRPAAIKHLGVSNLRKEDRGDGNNIEMWPFIIQAFVRARDSPPPTPPPEGDIANFRIAKIELPLVHHVSNTNDALC
jgi:hypothetical protein